MTRALEFVRRATLLVAGGVAALGGPALASEPCVDQFNFTNCPLGQAQLSVDADGHLVVSNIGSTGQDGVSIAMSGGPLGAIMGGVGLEAPGPAPNGSYMRQALISSLSSRARDRYEGFGATARASIASATITVVDEAAEHDREITVDFTPIGAATYAVEVYDAGVLVHSATGRSGPVARVGDWPRGGEDRLTETVTLNFTFPPGTSLEMLGGPVGTPVVGDELRITAESPLSIPPPIASLHVYAAGIASLAIVDEACVLEDGSTIVHGATHTPLGSASLDATLRWDPAESHARLDLEVTMPGLTADDGVSAVHDDGLPSFMMMTDIDEFSSLSSVELAPVGTTTVSRRASALASLGITKIGPAQLEIVPDFTPLGSSTATIRVYYEGVLMYTRTGHSGPAARLPADVSDLIVGEKIMLQQPMCYVGVLDPVFFDIVGCGSVLGDELHLAAEGATVLPVTRTAVELTAQNLLLLKIVEEGVGAVPGDVDGDHVVDVTDLLSVLGAWGPCPGACPPSCPEDLDGDCNVDVTDLLLVLASWS